MWIFSPAAQDWLGATSLLVQYPGPLTLSVPPCAPSEKGSPIKPTDAQRNVDIEGLSAEDLEYNYDKKGLAELRRRMKNAVADYQGGGG